VQQVLLNMTDPTNIGVSATALLVLGKTSASGDAHAKEDACGINVDEHGTWSADMSADASLTITGVAKLSTSGE